MATTAKKKKAKDVFIDFVPLEKVKQWPRNPKDHDTEAIEESVERFGFIQPLVMDEKTGRLVAGHGRLEVLARMKKVGMKPPTRVKVKGTDWLVPVLRGVRFRNEKEAQAYVIADNRTVELGGWDEQVLVELLGELKDDEHGLKGVGYDEDDMESLMAFISMVDKQDDSKMKALDDFEEPDKAYRIIVTCNTKEEVETLQEAIGVTVDAAKTTFRFHNTKFATG